MVQVWYIASSEGKTIGCGGPVLARGPTPFLGSAAVLLAQVHVQKNCLNVFNDHINRMITTAINFDVVILSAC